VLDIDSHGTTQTYGTRCLDTACELVFEYLRLSKSMSPRTSRTSGPIAFPDDRSAVHSA